MAVAYVSDAKNNLQQVSTHMESELNVNQEDLEGADRLLQIENKESTLSNAKQQATSIKDMIEKMNKVEKNLGMIGDTQQEDKDLDLVEVDKKMNKILAIGTKEEN